MSTLILSAMGIASLVVISFFAVVLIVCSIQSMRHDIGTGRNKSRRIGAGSVNTERNTWERRYSHEHDAGRSD